MTEQNTTTQINKSPISINEVGNPEYLRSYCPRILCNEHESKAIKEVLSLLGLQGWTVAGACNILEKAKHVVLSTTMLHSEYIVKNHSDE